MNRSVRYRAFGTVILKSRFITEVMDTVYVFYHGAWGFAASMIFKWKKLFFRQEIGAGKFKTERTVCLAPVPVIRDHYWTPQKLMSV